MCALPQLDHPSCCKLRRRSFIADPCAAASLSAWHRRAAIAADVSPWDDDVQSAARLIAAQARDEGGGRVFRAGVEIKLKDGWKTYWRYPGDSACRRRSISPSRRTSKSVTVLYPAPQRFPDGAGGNSIGYKGDVILPLHVVPQDARKPVTLNLKLDYAVCEKLCVPAEAKLELLLTGEPSAQDVTSLRPKRGCRSLPRSARPATPAIRAVHREAELGQAARRRGCRGAGRCAGDAVRRRPDRAVGIAAAASRWPVRPPGLQRFAFELDGLPPGEKARRRHAEAHGGRRRQGHRGRISARLVRRSALI